MRQTVNGLAFWRALEWQYKRHVYATHLKTFCYMRGAVDAISMQLRRLEICRIQHLSKSFIR